MSRTGALDRPAEMSLAGNEYPRRELNPR
jgi:hypothetical protein